jgi:hypothetical protein
MRIWVNFDPHLVGTIAIYAWFSLIAVTSLFFPKIVVRIVDKLKVTDPAYWSGIRDYDSRKSDIVIVRAVGLIVCILLALDIYRHLF